MRALSGTTHTDRDRSFLGGGDHRLSFQMQRVRTDRFILPRRDGRIERMVGGRNMEHTEGPKEPPALMSCPACGYEMRLFGIEADTPVRELYTFECDKCGRIEV